MTHANISTFGELKASGYTQKSIKDELRQNLILKLRAGENPFPHIFGYDHTVIPELQRAILSKHNINLLGLRGQAKTRIARLMVDLLDEWIPIIEGSEVNDDPFNPISFYGKEKIS
jgi:magnesium chelatase subunit I